MKQIALEQIRLDASTQIRTAITESLVVHYAERMLDGVTFPPIVLFFDGTTYFIGDGFHRVLAAQRAGAITIDAEVRHGSRRNALWFGLGANREHGHRMTSEDTSRALVIALETWPDMSTRMLANHIGCSQSLVQQVKTKLTASSQPPDEGADPEVSRTTQVPTHVNGLDGKKYPATKTRVIEKRPIIEAMLRDGATTEQIRSAVGTSHELVAKVRRELGMVLDRRPSARVERQARMVEMVAEGYSSRQIAAQVGISEEQVRSVMRDAGVEIPADRVTRNMLHHDANRIVAHMVMDAENLTADVGLIDYERLDAERLKAWVASLKASRDQLNRFISRLSKEQQSHEAA